MDEQETVTSLIEENTSLQEEIEELENKILNLQSIIEIMNRSGDSGEG